MLHTHRFYVFTFLFVILSTFCVSLVLMHTVDRPIAQAVLKLDPTLWHSGAAIITHLGRGEFIMFLNLLFIGLAIWFSKPLFYQKSIFGLVTMATACIGVDIPKIIFGRPRPYVQLPDEATFLWFRFHYDFNSFPSGHGAAMGAATVVFSYLFPTLRAPIFLLGILVSLSRVILHVHYFSDVMVGYVFGYSVAWMLKGLYETGYYSFVKKV